MSGKSATPAASRAGVPGAPRVLVYVAEPRQLEAAAAARDQPVSSAVTVPPLESTALATTPHGLYLQDNPNCHSQLPKNTAYRAQIEHQDQRNSSNTIIYKSISGDNDYETSDIVQRTEFFSLPHYVRDSSARVEENKVHEPTSNLGVKQDCANTLISELGSVDNFHNRIPVEVTDVTTYQPRCQSLVGTDNMPSIQPLVLHSGSLSDSGIIHSGPSGKNCSDKELAVDKGFVNYQFLEQSVSHQSIVNQSISILNQQVGVGRSIIGDCEGNNVPQLVRTADGVVLAVLPPSLISHPIDNPELGGLRSTSIELPQITVVPLGWRRIVNGSNVLYISPSGTPLSTLSQLRSYLQTAGTCKCGLPCPLRPETAFSFDPKVASKPYQAASGAELTKLCNHKRKLLATLQARAHSPATSPPHDKKVSVSAPEVTVLKKKMKKRPAVPNMSVSQLMMQRERPHNEFKSQDIEQIHTISPVITQQRDNNGQTCPPTFMPTQHNTLSGQNMLHDNVKQEGFVQRSSHYLTVSSGWITQQQQENIDTEQKQAQLAANPANGPSSAGMPVLGTNGQIIGVNTGHSKQILKNVTDSRKHSPQTNVLTVKQSSKDDESQVFCGLNQPLTPEVMQKINEQQQIFIQQNQKQIELAMKGYRTQTSENIAQNKMQNPNHFGSQAQLIIQNGAVVKTNPAKTPPWQVKKHDSNTPNSNTTLSPRLQHSESSDYEESNTSMSETSNPNNLFASEHDINTELCTRVPPLPQHYNMIDQQWPSLDINKKKAKNQCKMSKKKTSPMENKSLTFSSNGLRQVQDSKDKQYIEIATNNVPSFMDDPNGYLAQQTVLLNNTISRQVGISASYDNNQLEPSNNAYGTQNQIEKTNKQTCKSFDAPQVYRSNSVLNPSPSPNNVPDSSVLSEKALENSISQCCKDCNVTLKNNSDYSEHQVSVKYMKQNNFKVEMDCNPVTFSPRCNFDDNPVTSSTYIERSTKVNDTCGPIQAGTVSTSNVSPIETFQLPEPSPTPSNSSRSTDTPHSSGSYNSQNQSNCTFPLTSPANSNQGSSREQFNSNPSTPGSNQCYPYNSPGPPNNQSVTGTQMMHFISNHNVNKNLMEVDNISMVGVKPGLKMQPELLKMEPRKRIDNLMPGYCPPPHLGGGPAHTLIQACYVQTFVTTMASGFSVTRDTVTSVLAGKANTLTTSINASQVNFVRPPPPPSVNLATTYAIPNNQPDPFINSVNLPTSYPLHIAGTTAQNMISKSPLEMVQNVIGGFPSKLETNNSQNTSLSHINRRISQSTSGQILLSSKGQIVMSNNQMPPPPPKMATAVSPIQVSGALTSVTTSVTQVVPAVGGGQPIVNQPTVVVNTLPTPFVIQPPMMAVDGQVVQQNAVLPQIVPGGTLMAGHSPNESTRQIDLKTGQNYVQSIAMLSPESLKKRTKKKKNHTANITNVLHIAAPQQNPNNIMMHHSSPQHNSNSQFSPRGFQLSPNGNISPAPMLQALTIVPGKSGAPAHIVMNGQGSTNNFGSQQIITNSSPSQQINLLQPVNLINNASGVVPNFQAFQQFIVPNLGGMVMTTDGTALIQDNSTGMPMQLHLQTVNGQNVLTPMQNPGVFTAGANGGVVLRAQNQQGKIIQSQHSPGAQFLSPNSQVMMSSPNFNGQLSPLLANLSPTNVAFNTSPHQVRSGNVQAQEYLQTNQMGQTLMVPLSPKQVTMASASNNRSNSTLVQQNTTIVQQQTTLVSNSQNTQITNFNGGTTSRLSIDPQLLVQKQRKSYFEIPLESISNDTKDVKPPVALDLIESEEKVASDGYPKFMNEFNPLSCLSSHVRHSVSTQTLVQQQQQNNQHHHHHQHQQQLQQQQHQQRGKSPNQAISGSSPPDTTTHSPLGALERVSSPRLYAARCISTQGNYADTTTTSPEPADASCSAMVQCVSSSEQDMAETWGAPRTNFVPEVDRNMMSTNRPMIRHSRGHNPVESTGILYNHNMSQPVNSQQIVMPIAPDFCDRNQAYKRKNDFGDGPTYRTEKIMRTNYPMVQGLPKEQVYDGIGSDSPDKSLARRSPPSGNNMGTSPVHKFDRQNLGSNGDMKNEDTDEPQEGCSERPMRKFEVGELVWGPVKGYASWPGKLVRQRGDGRWAVRWFGARAPGAADAARLLTLSEGLEAHHAARMRHRKSRKLNTLLENAIQEAMAELDKKSDAFLSEALPLSETPKRSKKYDKSKGKERHHKKLISNHSKSFDNSRLRSSR